MKNITKTLLITVISIMFNFMVSYAQVTATDSLALVKLYDSTAGTFWTNNTNWKTASNVGEWHGITVSDGRVYQLDLASNNLSGQLPLEIGDLTALERLNISNNALNGNIPASVGNLINLNYLNFSWNNFTDASFPVELNQLSNLETLNLFSCNLTAVPMSVFELTNLKYLYLGYNQITSIPVALENLSLLESLNLGTNQLNGNAPPQLFKLANLVTLDLSRNGFTDVPTFITNMTWLVSLNMWGNSLDDADVTNFGNLTNLITLYLNDNLFTSIPDVLTSLTNIRYLYLSSNQITNNTLGNLENLVNLEKLSLNGNQLDKFPVPIFSLTKLKDLNLSYNQIDESIPASIASLPHLEGLYLHRNQIVGDVPQEVVNLSNLIHFTVQDNNLEGLPQLNSSNGFHEIKIENNYFTFEDIEPNLNVSINIFTYDPQKPVGDGLDTVLALGESISLNLSVGGTNNLYQWFKEELEISGATNSALNVNLNSSDDFGSYKLRITNTQATELELWSMPFNLTQENFLEQDSLALVAFYNALDGPNWANQGGWLTLPILNWSGISLQDNRVVEIQMENNRLKGQLPVELGELNALKFLQLNNNEILGSVPIQILNLTELEQLQLHFNNLEGIPDLHDLSKLNILKLEQNKFTFQDLEPNIGATTIFTYAPQDSLDIGPERLISLGNHFLLETPTPSANNSYYWYKDGNTVGGNSNPFDITSINYNDAGVYTCEVVNSAITDLSLHLKPVQVTVTGAPAVVYKLDEPSTPRTVEIPFQVNPGGLPTDITINYGVTNQYGMQAHWDKEPLQGTEFLDVSMLLTDLQPDQSYQYQIIAQNDSGTGSSPDQTFYTKPYPDSYTINTHLNIPSFANKEDYKSSDYRLFGVPGSNDILVSEFFSGKLDEDWVVYWDNGRVNDYYQKYSSSYDFNCSTGKAFWIMSLNEVNINRQVPAAVLNGFSQAEISLHDGWNLITNPFNEIVSWMDVEAANDLADAQIFDFFGSFGTPGQLDPFEGYLFYPSPNMTHLKIPFPGGATVTALEKNAQLTEMDWEVNLVLESDGFIDATTSFGVCNDLSEYEIVNHKKPRAMGDILNIYFEHPEWDELEPAYVTDFRPSDTENQCWNIETSVFPGKKATLSILNIDQIPQDQEVYMIQRDKGKYWNLRVKNNISFIPKTQSRSFEVIVGENEFVQDVLKNVVPGEFALEQNFPNPFNPTTSISYQLSDGSQVELSIYNGLGQKLRTLVDRRQEAGAYTVSFDASSLASGIYYYRISTSKFTRTRKMILLR